MNWILRKYIDKIYYIYTDDIAIFSNSMEEYKINIRLILEVLYKVDIIISIKKSSLFIEKIEFLGYIISSDGFKIMISKVEKILDWLALYNIMEIWVFLRFINYIDDFIPGFI
jgi:hypothetical protein